MRVRTLVVAFALTFALTSVAVAQTPSLLGRWTGSWDWTQPDDEALGRVDGAGWWELRSDGTFIDDANGSGRWWLRGNRITLRYGEHGTLYEGVVTNGNTIVGNMRTSDSSSTGSFSITRQ